MNASNSKTWLTRAVGRYGGTKLLWFHDPDRPDASEAEVRVADDRIDYTWSHEGSPQTGSMVFTFQPEGVEVEWFDSWHAKDTFICKGDHVADGIIVITSYGDASGPQWKWRTELRTPTPNELSIEMFNIEPSGAEQIAVRIRVERRRATR